MMQEELSLIDDLEQMGGGIYDTISEPGWAGTFVLAIIVLFVSWLVFCVGSAYI